MNKNNALLLQGVLESFSDGLIFVLDKHYQYIAFNENYRQFMKACENVEVQTGVKFQNVIRDGSQWQKDKKYFDKVLRGKKVAYVEQYTKKDCAEKWFQKELKPLYDTGCSEIIGLTVFMLDVTEKIQTQKALHTTKEKYEKLLNSLNEGVGISDENENFTFANPAAEEIFGVARGQLVGRNIKEFLTPPSWEKVLSETQKRAKGQLSKYELEIIQPSGDFKVIELSATPRFDKGKFIGTFAVFLDITEKKRAEQKLKQNEQKYRTFIENANDIIFAVDENGYYQYASPNWKDILGYSPEEVIGKNTADFVHPDHVPKLAEARDEIFHRGYYNGELEYLIQHKNGEWRWFASNTSRPVLYDWLDNRPLTIAIARDITERKLSERILQFRVDLAENIRQYTLEDVMQYILQEACEITDSKLGFYHTVNGDKKSLNPQACITPTLQTYCQFYEGKIVIPIKKGSIWERCIAHKKPAVFHQPDLLNQENILPENYPNLGELTQLMLIPILCNGKTVALLGVGEKPRIYTKSDQEILNRFANIAHDIINHKLIDDKIWFLSFHDRLTHLYNRTYMEEKINAMDTVTQLPLSIMMVDLNGLKLINDTYGARVGDEMLKQTADILKRTCGEDQLICRWGGDEFLILLPQTSREKAEQLTREIKENCKGEEIKNIPISLALAVEVKETPGEHIEKVMKSAEDKLYKQKLAENRSARSMVLNALLKTLETKSYETEAHAQRMLREAWKIGEKLSLPESEFNRLQLLITLHDIGKVNIPEDTLTKTTSLTREEWQMIKKHPEIGYKIALGTEEFAHVAEDIKSHHERWDGTGYPRGLKGGEIPFLARIAAIVDAYDVMSNGRPYKKAKSPGEIISEFKKCAGTQFDPALSDLFIQILEGKS